jgi:hypothetical protein
MRPVGKRLMTILKTGRAVFSRLKLIPNDDPEQTPAAWCRVQPCIKIRIASKDLVISQPLSTVWVYLLGLLTVGVGVYFFQIQNHENSRFWWAVSLLLWGIGALLAGTSYQAFGYELKCKDRKVCVWTSWWEVVYLACQQVSMNAMFAAMAYSCTTGTLQKVLLGYSLVNSGVYLVLVFVGGVVPVKSLIRFEFMVYFSTPALFFSIFWNSLQYHLFRNPLDLVLLVTWILLLCTMMAYWIYLKLGITKKLWAKGIWFSENDVLHVLLIFWMIYIATVVADHIKDYA